MRSRWGKSCAAWWKGVFGEPSIRLRVRGLRDSVVNDGLGLRNSLEQLKRDSKEAFVSACRPPYVRVVFGCKDSDPETMGLPVIKAQADRPHVIRLYLLSLWLQPEIPTKRISTAIS